MINFNGLVIKIASRCNLNCSYCFMYNLGDETYKLQPKFMKEETVDDILLKAKNYLKKYNKKQFKFLFHGGEPLLMKQSFFATFCEKAKVIQEELPDMKLDFVVQTNGVLIDKSWCDLFNKYKINVSISIDGAKEAHDMYRKDHAGKGSYDEVMKGAMMAKKELGYLNLVSVININESPKENYEAFRKIESTAINYLLTDYTYDNYPYESNQTPTADWLIELFDLWVNDTRKRFVPFFVGMMKKLLGISNSEHNEVTLLVIETNGEIEVIDSMKACGNAFTKSNLTIRENEISDIEETSLGKLYFNESTNKLCKKCEECPIKNVCKGGRLVHRYSSKNGFNNPSVYCRDLVKIISHIQGYLIDQHSKIYKQEEVSRMNFQEIIDYLDHLNINEAKQEIQYRELEEFKY
ncbi:MAG: radical SAM protein [Flavobacteriaceae bacterium]